MKSNKKALKKYSECKMLNCEMYLFGNGFFFYTLQNEIFFTVKIFNIAIKHIRKKFNFRAKNIL